MAVDRLRELCLALPEVTERLNHGEPSWAVRGKTIVTFSERKPAGRVGFWGPAPPGELEALVAAEPERFFQPPFGGPGWVGVYLDVPVDWVEVRELIVEAYRLVAPKSLAERLCCDRRPSDRRMVHEAAYRRGVVRREGLRPGVPKPRLRF